jgi:maltooligosyltrehalose synthase
MDFVRHLASSPTFRDDAAAWIGRIGPAAATISLAMVILKAICPGTLDVYQGNEVWEYALTDPDNRRPVDFDHLSASLQCLVAGIRESAATDDPAIKAEALLRHWPDGRLKLHVLHSLLVQRRDNPLLFANGSFFLLDVNGPQSEHVIALGRRHQDQWIIALMPRLMRPLRLEGEFALGQGSWSGTSFNFPDDAPRRWTDILTGQVHTAESGAPFGLATALTVLPVAVLAAG